LTGRLTPAGRKAIDTSALTRTHAGNGGGGADVYDGWIIDYYFSGSVPAGTNISTEWLVPALPTKVGNQDIAFFNDIETNNLILQPVLDFSEIPGKWAIESENCCLSGNDIQSELVQVSPGDRILGVVTAASCDSTGVCKNWTVTTTDVTTGKSTVLNMQNPKEAANEINPAVLETYNVTSCDMLPANGEVAFYNNVVTSGSGVEPLKYTLDKLAGMAPAGFPKDCGYGGAVSGNTYTLYFGKSPAPIVDAAAGGGDVDSGATGGMGGLTGADAGNAMGGSGGSSNTGADGGAAGTGAAGTGAAGAPGSSPGTDAPGSSTAGAAGPSGVDASSNPASGGGGSSSSANRGADRASGGCDIANPTNPHGMSPSFIGLGIGLFLLRRSRRRRG